MADAGVALEALNNWEPELLEAAAETGVTLPRPTEKEFPVKSQYGSVLHHEKVPRWEKDGFYFRRMIDGIWIWKEMFSIA